MLLRRFCEASSICLLLTDSCQAHAFTGSGWLHPLTGIDHMVAMVAVGAWSAQLGGRAILVVPAAFLCSMLIGGALGFEHVRVGGTELGISLSVLLLGIAITTESKVTLALAAAGVALFGICHGYAHGYEIPATESRLSYTVGFVLTTACLHVVGAAGGLLLLEEPAGRRRLRLAGAVAAATGAYLSLNAFTR